MKKAIFAYFATATAAMAHPGHGEAPGHWLTRPDHILGLVVLAVVGGVVLTQLIRNRD